MAVASSPTYLVFEPADMSAMYPVAVETMSVRPRMTFCLFRFNVSGWLMLGGERESKMKTDRPWPGAKEELGGVEDGELLGRLDDVLRLDGENVDVFDHHSCLHLGYDDGAQSGESGED